MKITLLSGSTTIKDILEYDDIIVYSDLIKLMDNMLEINPDVILWDCDTYPEQCDIFCEYYKSNFSKSPNLVLLTNKDILPVANVVAKKFFLYEKTAIQQYIKSFDNERISMFSKIKNNFLIHHISFENKVDIIFNYKGELEVYYATLLKTNSKDDTKNGEMYITNADFDIKSGEIDANIITEAKNITCSGYLIVDGLMNRVFIKNGS